MIGILKKITKNLVNETNETVLSTIDNGTNQTPIITTQVETTNHKQLLWIENEIPNLKDAIH